MVQNEFSKFDFFPEFREEEFFGIFFGKKSVWLHKFYQ